ncbi:MAG: Rieske (2Fe-2S) protein [Methanoregulaceae archaeon]|nr:Rieske (2Fe-2S) protein [Methanoregulaceae archaeon]
MTIVQAGPAKDIMIGTMKAVAAGDMEILVANIEGEFFSIGNKCTHRGCKLSNGRMMGDHIICPCHGSTFDLRTGGVVKGPAKEPEHSYRVKVENDTLLVEV